MGNDFYYGGAGIMGQKMVSSGRQFVAIFPPYVTLIKSLILVIVFQVLVFIKLYYDLPWILWKHVVTDVCLFVFVPMYITIFVNVYGDIWDYCQYEKRNLEHDIQKMKRNSYLEVWDEVKYYPYVDEEDCAYVYCCVGAYTADLPEGERIEIDAVLEEEIQQ